MNGYINCIVLMHHLDADTQELDITGWRHEGVTSEAFRPLTALRRLTMRHCDQPGIGDAAFELLGAAPLATLDISHCTQVRQDHYAPLTVSVFTAPPVVSRLVSPMLPSATCPCWSPSACPPAGRTA